MAARRTSPWAAPRACGPSRPYGTLKSIFPTPNAHLAYRDLQGPAPLRRHADRRDGLAVDGSGAGPLVYVQWGTAAEYSNYDSTNRTVVDCSQRAYKHILVDPRMTPLGKEADLWLPLRVGTDLCLSLGWLKWISTTKPTTTPFVRRWTNAPFLWNPEEPVAARRRAGFQEMQRRHRHGEPHSH